VQRAREESPPKKKERSAEDQARLNQIKAKYGDASATKGDTKKSEAKKATQAQPSTNSADVIRLGFS